MNYGNTSINKYLIAFAAVFILMIIGIILIFSGGGGGPEEEKLKPLPDYSNTFAEVSLTIDGRVVGEDAKRSIRITVGQYQRRLDIITGYNGNIQETHTFTNSEQAYDIFLRAINGAGFLLERELTPAAADERGKCALGQRYIYELNDSGEELSYLWTSSCGSKTGTLAGRNSTLQQLFKLQITDYSKLTSKTKL